MPGDTIAADTAAWAQFLDVLEAEVRDVGHTLDTRGTATFLPPSHLGPLPGELEGRVREVLATIAETSRALRAGIDHTRERLGELERHDPRGPKPASTFDARA